MSKLARGICVIFAIAVVAGPLYATTYVVPEDRLLVDQSHAIVAGTVVDKHVRVSERAGIETVSVVQVDEGIKGTITGQTIEVVEPGGTYGGVTRVIAGVPDLEVGERVLLMLRSKGADEWVILDMSLGRFDFVRDTHGQTLLVREEAEISGWDPQLKPYVERRRSAASFLAFVREQVNGHEPAVDYFVPSFPLESRKRVVSVESHSAVPNIAPFTAKSYATGVGARRPGFTSFINYGRGTTAESGAPGGGDNAINAAMNAWSGVSGADIRIAYNNQVRSDTGLQPNNGDGQNTVQFERDISWVGAPPFTCSPSGYSGVLGIGGFHNSGPHSGPNGESFLTITEGDVEMNVGLANCTLLFSNGDFDTAVTHEVGHSIGFRHADTANDNQSPCVSGSMECSQQAIMKAFISQGIHAQPQTWDQHAAQAIYPGAVVCTNPSISVQPSGSTINAGQSANLTVSANGTTPTFQWYVGSPPTITSPVPGGATSSISVSPSSTTTYFVRVSGCSTFVDSNAVTVTVNCAPPAINQQPAGASISVGSNAQLTVGATGSALTYQWYQGTAPDTSTPVSGGTGSSVFVAPTTTTNYWVRVSGACGTPQNSSTVTVTVTCTPPAINQQPVGTSITSGSNAQLTVGATGSALNYQWYQGTAPATSSPVPGGGGSSVFVAPTTTTNYWVRVSGACGTPQNSNTITITVGVCANPTISGASALPSQIQAGQSSSLSATISGGTAQWYRGTPPDKSNPLPQSGVNVTVSPTTTTNYWLQVTSTCGSPAANSPVVTVTIVTCATPTVTTPANQSIVAGLTATITVSAGGTAPLHYQWYKGASGIKTTPAGTDSPTLTTEAVNATLKYWVEVTNSCGGSASAQSGTVTITPILTRYRSSRH